MTRYAQSKDCRENRLVRYFGEDGHEGCGRCDMCRGLSQPRASASGLARTQARSEAHASGAEGLVP
jgi:superfamily II DNA helicase RecQ